MAQQINLMHAGLTPQPEPYRSGQAAWMLAAIVGACLLLVFGLRLLAASHSNQADAVEQQLAALQARAASLGAAAQPERQASELRQLREVVAGQRRVRAALDSGVAGRTQGYAQYFMALSRQAEASLWITGFSVAADGAALELQGRMTDPHVLPDYLRRLNSEPLFKGREFAQMRLKAIEPSAAEGSRAGPVVTEFALLAKPAQATP